MKKFRVMVCQFPGGNSTHPDVGDWLAETLYKMKTDGRIGDIRRFKLNETPITMSRNRAVKEAIETNCDYVLMIDSDMGPDYAVGQDPLARPFWDVAWGFMMKRREEEEDPNGAPAGSDWLNIDGKLDYCLPPATIAAPYCGPPPLELPYIFRWKNRQSDNPDPDYYLECLERSDAAMRSGIEEVAALPTGLILYDTRVFKALEAAQALPWFDYEYSDPPYNTKKATTEDVWQTRNGTLLEPSMPLYVAWDCWAIHYKTKAVKKPVPVTAAAVKGVMKQAVASQYEDHNDKILMVHRHDPQFVAGPVVGNPGGQEAKPEASPVPAVEGDDGRSEGYVGTVALDSNPGVGRSHNPGDDWADVERKRASAQESKLLHLGGGQDTFGYR